MRKIPRQERSRALVQSLIEAATLTIADEGLEAATTIRIAERAGVSVGSLYQYFDKKEDIYAAVLESVTQQLELLIDEGMKDIEGLTTPQFVRKMLDKVWDWLEENDGLYLRVIRYWSHLDGMGFISQLENKMILAIALFLTHSPLEKPVRNLQSKIYLFTNMSIFTVIRYISHPPANIHREELLDGIAEISEQLLG